MQKEDYLKITSKKYSKGSLSLVNEAIELYYSLLDKHVKSTYELHNDVKLRAGTLIHGTNLEGLKNICKQGLIASDFINGRISKYPGAVGMWNLKKDYYLKDYVDFYSGGTIKFYDDSGEKTQVIPYSNMRNIIDIVKESKYYMWKVEQTKESRFMPNLTMNNDNVGIIFANCDEINKLKKYDILDTNINDEGVKQFVNEAYYDRFIIDRKQKDDFFTDRESAILFGIPKNFIEGIIVGKNFENNNNILLEIKQLIPNSYICNLEGKVIVV